MSRWGALSHNGNNIPQRFGSQELPNLQTRVERKPGLGEVWAAVVQVRIQASSGVRMSETLVVRDAGCQKHCVTETLCVRDAVRQGLSEAR